MSKQWLKAALIRAVKTFAQTALGTLGGSALFTEVHWGVVLSASVMAAIYSLLTSIKGLPEVPVGGETDENNSVNPH